MTAALVIAVAVLIAFPFAYEELRRPVSRVYGDGASAKLPSGTTFYRWSGPEGGPVAVCVHGLTTPSIVFSGVSRALSALGYRVLVYDLYGRGLSDRPAGQQTPAFFLRQLRELLADQGVTGRYTLIGYSMGASIASALAAREGSRVDALVLLAPAGVKPVPALPYDSLLTLPVFGDWLMRLAGGWLLRRQLAAAGASPTMVPDLREKQIAETRTRGYLPAVLSARRHTLTRTHKTDHETIRDNGTPVLAIWGRDDSVIPIKTMGTLAHLNPDAHHVEIADAGHEFLQTHPSRVAEALRWFLKEHPPR